NALASLLAIVTLVSYLFLYTPLKRKTPLCTLVGAFPGAMPPLIGWAAASGRLSPEAWALYAALFLWQFPHFMAIAWMYREDYSRAGYLVLPSGKSKAGFMGWLTVLQLLGLNLVTLMPAFTGHAGPIYPVGAFSISAHNWLVENRIQQPADYFRCRLSIFHWFSSYLWSEGASAENGAKQIGSRSTGRILESPGRSRAFEPNAPGGNARRLVHRGRESENPVTGQRSNQLNYVPTLFSPA